MDSPTRWPPSPLVTGSQRDWDRGRCSSGLHPERMVGIVGKPTRAVTTGPHIHAGNDGREFGEPAFTNSRWQKAAHVEVAVVVEKDPTAVVKLDLAQREERPVGLRRDAESPVRSASTLECFVTP